MTFVIESPESQTAEEAADDAVLVRIALKHEFPGEWLNKAFRIGNVKQARQDRVRALLAKHVEQVDHSTIEEGLPCGCFTASQA
jgi:hypothetical protein